PDSRPKEGGVRRAGDGRKPALQGADRPEEHVGRQDPDQSEARTERIRSSPYHRASTCAAHTLTRCHPASSARPNARNGMVATRPFSRSSRRMSSVLRPGTLKRTDMKTEPWGAMACTGSPSAAIFW